jgi:hypothetical protein
MHFFAQLSSSELKTSLQMTKCLALLMLKQAGGAKKMHRTPLIILLKA